MTPETDQEPTSRQIADIATVHVDLPRLALLGVFGSASARAALIRQRTGKTTRVIPGDAIGTYHVAAIGDDRVVLSRGEQTKILTLPQG